MALSTSTVLFLIVVCGLWVAKARQYNSILTVPNGGRWGRWGPVQFCSKGHAVGFQLKVELYGTYADLTGLNAITLLCDNGERIASKSGPWGIWQRKQYCPEGKLIAFALRVQEEISSGDKTAANNIVFLCSDHTAVVGYGVHKGKPGPKSHQCQSGAICGIQTKVQSPRDADDDTALNDVRMFCCD